MSLTVAGGFILGSGDLYQDWDPSLSRNPGAASADNRGCAPGWATIYVQDSITGNTVKVCRRVTQDLLDNAPAIIAAETGPDWYDESIMNVAEVSEQIVSGGGDVLNALSPALSSTAMLLAAAAILLFVWKK